MKYKDQRVGVFIDIQNLYHSAKHLYGAKVNFSNVLDYVVEDRKLIRAIGYVVKSDISIAEASFFETLEKNGIELRMKDLQIFAGGAKKADWDIGMAVDAIRMSEFLDVIILITGDGDFIPLVQYLQQGRGRQVEVASFARSTSLKLQEVADIYINLEDRPSILIKNRIRKSIKK